MVQTQDLISKIQMRGWSKEVYLLGHDKYNLNRYSNNQSDLPRSSSDKDVHHKCIRMMRTQKYLRESCYYRIEYIAATFLAAFMWRRPLNSVALVTTNHRKQERVFDGIDIQVRVQMINKCRIKMV